MPTFRTAFVGTLGVLAALALVPLLLLGTCSWLVAEGVDRDREVAPAPVPLPAPASTDSASDARNRSSDAPTTTAAEMVRWEGVSERWCTEGYPGATWTYTGEGFGGTCLSP